jgi:type IV secretory pathway TraG/TraD family ATPase VirD4
VLDRIPAEREQDLIVLDLACEHEAWGLNLFACPDPTSAREVARTVDHVLQAFGKIWGDMQNTPGLADMLRMITITLVSNPGATVADIHCLLADDATRERLVANVNDQTVRDFWDMEYNRLTASGRQQMRASLTRRIRALLTPLLYNIVSQATNSIDFRSVMDEGKILLVQLDAELEDLTSILGTVMVGQLLQAALSRKDVEREDRRPFFLYADEYHRFATPFFSDLIQESRKYNIATVMAHQSRYQLKILGEEISKTPLRACYEITFTS